MDDHELLREYVGSHSETAFAELVARHLNLVYATALRLVGDSQAAQDVAQTVFILLARQAWKVPMARLCPPGYTAPPAARPLMTSATNNAAANGRPKP